MKAELSKSEVSNHMLGRSTAHQANKGAISMSDEMKEIAEDNPVELKSDSEPQASQETKPPASDSLAGWAIWAVVFAILSVTIVGGAIGGLIAGVISFPITKALPVRSDGRKLPVALSIMLIIAAIIVFMVGISVLMKR